MSVVKIDFWLCGFCHFSFKLIKAVVIWTNCSDGKQCCYELVTWYRRLGGSTCSRTDRRSDKPRLFTRVTGSVCRPSRLASTAGRSTETSRDTPTDWLWNVVVDEWCDGPWQSGVTAAGRRWHSAALALRRGCVSYHTLHYLSCIPNCTRLSFTF